MAQKNNSVQSQPSVRAQAQPAVYVNGWGIQLGASEITLTLGNGGVIDGEAVGVTPVVSVALTHSRFIDFATEVQRIALILEKLYGGQLPSIRDYTQDRLNAAIAEATEELQKK